MASWPPPEAARSVLDGVEHGVTLTRVGTVRPTLGWLAAASAGVARPIRGEPAVCAAIPRLTTLYSVGLSEDHDHDAVMRIGGRFRGGGSNLQVRPQSARVGIGAPPPRIVWAAHKPANGRRAPSLRSYKAPWLVG